MFRDGKVTSRIYRFSIAANLEVQTGPLIAIMTDFGDALSARDVLIIAHQQSAIMRVGTEKFIVVFDDHQVAITLEPIAAIHDATRRGGLNRLTFAAADVHAHDQTVLFAQRHRPLRRPTPLDVNLRGRLREYRRGPGN